jgi:hypothetical protein
MTESSRLEFLKARIDALIARLHRTTFRDHVERELLVSELGRAIEGLPATGKHEVVAAPDPDLLRDSIEASAAVENAFRALTEPEPKDAWSRRVTRLEGYVSLLLASEEDLLEAEASKSAA